MNIICVYNIDVIDDLLDVSADDSESMYLDSL